MQVSESKAVPVVVEPVESDVPDVTQPQRSTIHIELRQAQVRIEGSADPALPANTRIWIAAGATDLRRGFTGLSALVQTKLPLALQGEPGLRSGSG